MNTLSTGGLTHIHTHHSKDANLPIQLIGQYLKRHTKSEYFIVNDHITSPYSAKKGQVPHSEINNRIQALLCEIHKYNNQSSVPNCYSGVEANIVENGVDIPDDLLGNLDFVIASRHHPWGQEGMAQALNNLIAAMQNSYIDAIGHIDRYTNDEMNWNEVFKQAEITGTIIELSLDHLPSQKLLDIIGKYKLIVSIGLDFHIFSSFFGSKPDILLQEIGDITKTLRARNEGYNEINELYFGFDFKRISPKLLRKIAELRRRMKKALIQDCQIINTKSQATFTNILKTPKPQRYNKLTLNQ